MLHHAPVNAFRREQTQQQQQPAELLASDPKARVAGKLSRAADEAKEASMAVDRELEMSKAIFATGAGESSIGEQDSTRSDDLMEI